MEYEPRKCVICGKEFTPLSAKRIYCSLACKVKAASIHRKERRQLARQCADGQAGIQQRGEKIVRECVVCGRAFVCWKSASKITCSPECALARKVQAQAELARPEDSKALRPKRRCHDVGFARMRNRVGCGRSQPALPPWAMLRGKPTNNYRCQRCWEKYRSPYAVTNDLEEAAVL